MGYPVADPEEVEDLHPPLVVMIVLVLMQEQLRRDGMMEEADSTAQIPVG